MYEHVVVAVAPHGRWQFVYAYDTAQEALSRPAVAFWSLVSYASVVPFVAYDAAFRR